jgi:hypothetical protein
MILRLFLVCLIIVFVFPKVLSDFFFRKVALNPLCVYLIIVFVFPKVLSDIFFSKK